MSRSAPHRPGVSRPSRPKSVVARDAEAWVVRLASREITPRQLKRFEAWRAASSVHQTAFDEARTAWLVVGRLDPDGAGRALRAVSKPRRAALAAVRRAGPVAAALLLCSGAAAFAADNWTAWTSDVVAGETVRTLRLPDGTVAILDAGAAMDLAYTPDQRVIYLREGQAWFSVQPNAARPFVVRTDHVTARAMGSSYAVRKDAGGDQVTVTTGKVAVAGPGDVSAVMVSGGVTRSYVAGRPRDLPARESATSWLSGRLVLEGVSVREALDEIDRYRPGRLIVLDAPRAPMNAVFFVDDLDRAVSGLAADQNLELTKVFPGVTLVTVGNSARPDK